jgi:hypothetical protein
MILEAAACPRCHRFGSFLIFIRDGDDLVCTSCLPFSSFRRGDSHPAAPLAGAPPEFSKTGGASWRRL